MDLLISMRQNLLHPVPLKTIGGMTLYHRPLGKVFGRSDVDLEFFPVKTSYPQFGKLRRMLLLAARDDEKVDDGSEILVFKARLKKRESAKVRDN